MLVCGWCGDGLLVKVRFSLSRRVWRVDNCELVGHSGAENSALHLAVARNYQTHAAGFDFMGFFLILTAFSCLQTHPDLKNLTDALVAVKKYADDMNKTVKLSENKKEFTRLAGIIEGLGAIKVSLCFLLVGWFLIIKKKIQSPLLFSDEKMKISTEGQVYNWMILFRCEKIEVSWFCLISF